tara:strand:+ start:375 stop:668 length:294 start_codon:yes stop_codon:yes gene_type:complete
MTEVYIQKSKAKDKRLMAKFPNKTTHFGLKGGNTYLEHGDDKTKDNYLKRHKVRENWADYTSAGSLSKNILWNKKTMKSSINDLNSKQNKYKFVYKP